MYGGRTRSRHPVPGHRELAAARPANPGGAVAGARRSDRNPLRIDRKTAGFARAEGNTRVLPSGDANRDNRGLGISITHEAFDSRDAQRLIAALDAGLAELYPPEQRFGPNLKAQHLAEGRGTFLVARDNGRAVGCGAFRLLDATTAEIKRMYVEPDQRGKGVGRAVLASLQTAAEQLGARRLVLETGSHSPEALTLYRRAGFRQIECWGEYATSPTSVCMEKPL